MPAYRVAVPRRVQKQIARLPVPVQDRLEQAINSLAEDPRPPRRSLKLSGATGNRRLRVGDYRMIYAVDDEERTVFILEVWHRQRDYR